MPSHTLPVIAVIGATGQQGGSVLRALQANGRFRVRALTRNPDKHPGLADEVAAADLNRPETLKAAFAGAHGVFMVTDFQDKGGTGEIAQGTAAVHAARDAGVDHFIWSTLPDVQAISNGHFDVGHFTNKSKVDAAVSGAGFAHHTFVMPPFLFQNLLDAMAPQPQADGSKGWALPIDPEARMIHAGDVNDLGPLVAGAFTKPDVAGNGQYLPLVGQLLSFGDIVATLNAQGHAYSYRQVPAEEFATFFPGAREFAAMFGYFQAHSYLGENREDAILLARRVAGVMPADFATWARSNMPPLPAGHAAIELMAAR